ncbi:hypothetical protein ATCC90586_010167 [Pythium insidiosum]|nr:hypothetical protein ATCC90586_010167 [Pythium insidiosum]
MEYGIDHAIERLHALKLQTPASNGERSEPASNQDVPCDQRTVLVMQRDFEGQLRDRELMIQRMQHEMDEMQRRVQALEHQNQLLRNALSSGDVYRAQVADQQLVIDGLQDQVKQLRLTNYRLQFMVQQNERHGGQGHFLPPPPPDVF